MKKIIFLPVFLLMASACMAQQPDKVQLPHDPYNHEVCTLRSCLDSELKKKLTTECQRKTLWAGLIRKNKLCIGLVDLSNMNDVRFANINGDKMMYAASLPKIAVLLAAMDAIEKNELIETREVRKDLRLMISKSNNKATTRMIDRLGYDKIEAVLTDPRYELYDREYGGGLWVGKRYAAQGERNPDPMKGLSHAATASQVCRFYYLMATGQLINPERSAQMLDIMADPELHHKFVNTLNKIAPQAKLYRKSGSWRSFHSDSVLVWGPDRQYILVALVDHPEGETIIRELVKSVEEILEIE